MDTCGAKTRAGTPCKQKVIYGNGRCKFHGGLATGPTTEAGKEQCRINGRKGGRPRKDGEQKTEVLAPQENPKIRLDAQVAARVSDASKTTEVLEHEESGVSTPWSGKVQGRVEITGSQAPERPEPVPEKPKSGVFIEGKVSVRCERCAMFAGGSACLAVAKGMIPIMTAGDTCAAFSDL